MLQKSLLQTTFDNVTKIIAMRYEERTLKQTTRENGRVAKTSPQLMPVNSNPQRSTPGSRFSTTSQNDENEG